MKPEDLGVKVTVLEGLAYLVPGTVFIWVLVQIEARFIGYLPDAWPVTSLDTAMVAALVILSGVALQETGHLFNWPYDKFYAARRWEKPDSMLEKVKAYEAARAEAAASPVGHHFNHAKAALSNAKRPVERVLLLEGISKMFRALAIGCLVLTICLGVLGDLIGAGIAVCAMLVALYIFARYRFASSVEVYQAYLQWRHETDASPPVTASDPPPRPDAS